MTLTLWGLWHGTYGKDNTQDIINNRDNYQPPDMVWDLNKPGPDANPNLAIKRRGAAANFSQGFDVKVWTHIAIAMDGVNVRFYKNGVFIDELPYVYAKGYNARIHMGSAGNIDGSYREVDAFNGALDDVCFYSRKLTDAEILSIYEGKDTPLAVEENYSKDLTRFELTQNFPNPFNPSTRIHYIGKDTKVEIAVYNLLGNRVTTMVNAFQNAGSHQVSWDASNASAGVYFCQMKTNGLVETKKMLLVK